MFIWYFNIFGTWCLGFCTFILHLGITFHPTWLTSLFGWLQKWQWYVNFTSSLHICEDVFCSFELKIDPFDGELAEILNSSWGARIWAKLNCLHFHHLPSTFASTTVSRLFSRFSYSFTSTGVWRRDHEMDKRIFSERYGLEPKMPSSWFIQDHIIFLPTH